MNKLYRKNKCALDLQTWIFNSKMSDMSLSQMFNLQIQCFPYYLSYGCGIVLILSAITQNTLTLYTLLLKSCIYIYIYKKQGMQIIFVSLQIVFHFLFFMYSLCYECNCEPCLFIVLLVYYNCFNSFIF